jgi:hypothetical protein
MCGGNWLIGEMTPQNDQQPPPAKQSPSESHALDKSYDCVVCGVGATPHICGGCAKVVYCSQHCQQLDWRKHAYVCATTNRRPLFFPTPSTFFTYIFYMRGIGHVGVACLSDVDEVTKWAPPTTGFMATKDVVSWACTMVFEEWDRRHINTVIGLDFPSYGQDNICVVAVEGSGAIVETTGKTTGVTIKNVVVGKATVQTIFPNDGCWKKVYVWIEKKRFMVFHQKKSWL